MERLKGRTVLVTGGAAGVGQALAIAFAREGARLIIADLVDGADTVSKIQVAGGSASSVRCDISLELGIASMMQAPGMAGGVDVLVNSAGIFPLGSLESDPSLWDRVFAINVRGNYLTTRAVVPGMKQRAGGKIINLASALFFAAAPGLLAYIASKGAIVGLTRALARELGEHNIQVNAIAPGMIDTPGVLSLQLPPEAVQSLTAGQCINRRERTDDLIGAAILLASSDSDFITGQVLVIDGGFVFH